MERTDLHASICIIGGGSAGFGAACMAARAGCTRVALVESGHALGGTSTLGGVCCWEPGVAGPGLHYEVFERLNAIPGAVAIGRTTKRYTPDEPWGLSGVDPTARYGQTLRRCGLDPSHWRRVTFEPWAMQRVMHDIVRKAGDASLLFSTVCRDVHVRDGRIKWIEVVDTTGSPIRIHAEQFLDCSADIAPTRMAGCSVVRGEDARSTHAEPSAPETAGPTVNGVSLLFRISRDPHLPPDRPVSAVAGAEARDWATGTTHSASINQLPSGDLSINVLPTMEGSEYPSLPSHEATRRCRERTFAYWESLREAHSFFKPYRLRCCAPRVGVRESYRLRGRSVLTEQDVRGGLDHRCRTKHAIAYADHALDTHGRSRTSITGAAELEEPYGVEWELSLIHI